MDLENKSLNLISTCRSTSKKAVKEAVAALAAGATQRELEIILEQAVQDECASQLELAQQERDVFWQNRIERSADAFENFANMPEVAKVIRTLVVISDFD